MIYDIYKLYPFDIYIFVYDEHSTWLQNNDENTDKSRQYFPISSKRSSVSIGKNSLKVVAPTTLLVEEYHARILPLRQTSQIHE